MFLWTVALKTWKIKSLLLFHFLIIFSMIFVEIATRCELISVSMTASAVDYNLWLYFDHCFITSSLL